MAANDRAAAPGKSGGSSGADGLMRAALSAVALALASAASDIPLPKNLVAIGEVGLAGEVRRVTGVQRRLAEAHRLGFTHALVPTDPGKVPAGMKVLEVADIGAALSVLPRSRRREAPRDEEQRR